MYPPIRMSILDPCPQLQVLCNILPAIYCCCARNDALYWYCAMCCRCAWHVLLIDVHDMCYWLMCKTCVIDWHAWHVLLMDVHDVLLTDVQDMCYWLVTCVTVVTSVTYLIHEKNNNKKTTTLVFSNLVFSILMASVWVCISSNLFCMYYSHQTTAVLTQQSHNLMTTTVSCFAIDCVLNLKTQTISTLQPVHH